MPSGWNNEQRAKAYRANKERIAAHDELVKPHFDEFRRARLSYANMARALNERGVPSAGAALAGHGHGGTWTATMAKRIHDRLYFRCQETGDLFG